MKKMTREEKHLQCVREIKATLISVAICCAWHIITAFVLNKKELYILGMPAWFVVSVFGTVIIAIVSVLIITKRVFVDFEYDEEEGEES